MNEKHLLTLLKSGQHHEVIKELSNAENELFSPSIIKALNEHKELLLSAMTSCKPDVKTRITSIFKNTTVRVSKWGTLIPDILRMIFSYFTWLERIAFTRVNKHWKTHAIPKDLTPQEIFPHLPIVLENNPHTSREDDFKSKVKEYLIEVKSYTRPSVIRSLIIDNDLRLGFQAVCTNDLPLINKLLSCDGGITKYFINKASLEELNRLIHFYHDNNPSINNDIYCSPLLHAIYKGNKQLLNKLFNAMVEIEVGPPIYYLLQITIKSKSLDFILNNRIVVNSPSNTPEPKFHLDLVDEVSLPQESLSTITNHNVNCNDNFVETYQLNRNIVNYCALFNQIEFFQENIISDVTALYRIMHIAIRFNYQDIFKLIFPQYVKFAAMDRGNDEIANLLKLAIIYDHINCLKMLIQYIQAHKILWPLYDLYKKEIHNSYLSNDDYNHPYRFAKRASLNHPQFTPSELAWKYSSIHCFIELLYSNSPLFTTGYFAVDNYFKEKRRYRIASQSNEPQYHICHLEPVIALFEIINKLKESYSCHSIDGLRDFLRTFKTLSYIYIPVFIQLVIKLILPRVESEAEYQKYDNSDWISFRNIEFLRDIIKKLLSILEQYTLPPRPLDRAITNGQNINDNKLEEHIVNIQEISEKSKQLISAESLTNITQQKLDTDKDANSFKVILMQLQVSTNSQQSPLLINASETEQLSSTPLMPTINVQVDESLKLVARKLQIHLNNLDKEKFSSDDEIDEKYHRRARQM